MFFSQRRDFGIDSNVTNDGTSGIQREKVALEIHKLPRKISERRIQCESPTNTFALLIGLTLTLVIELAHRPADGLLKKSGADFFHLFYFGRAGTPYLGRSAKSHFGQSRVNQRSLILVERTGEGGFGLSVAGFCPYEVVV